MARQRPSRPVSRMRVLCVLLATSLFVCTRSLATTPGDDVSLPFHPSNAPPDAALPDTTTPGFAFDGTTSDIARQLYYQHVAGHDLDQVLPNRIPTRVTARLVALNVSFSHLPGLLQRALLWDAGYVISPENEPVQMWTLGGRPMAHLALSEVEFRATGCAAMECPQPDGTTYKANVLCTGTQILTAAKCLMDDFDSTTSTHLALWSNGGDRAMIPEIRAVMHGWMDAATNNSYLLYAVHTMSMDAEPAYGTCNKGGYGSLVVPCYPMSGTSVDVVAVMSEPVATPWITTWIKQYQSTADTVVNNQSDRDDHGFDLWLLIPIIGAVVVVAIFIFFAVFRKRWRLRSIYWHHDDESPEESDDTESRQDNKVSAPATGRDNRTSLRHTVQETLGEFSQTFRLPEEETDQVEEPSPGIEEVLPRPRRNTAGASRSTSAARTSVPAAVQPNPRVVQSSAVLAAQRTAPESRTQVSARTTPTARSKSCGTPTSASRQFTATAAADRHTTTKAMNRASRNSGSGERSKSDVRCTKPSTRSHAHAARDILLTHREAVSIATNRELMPSIRDSIQADRESIPAMRETFGRYSAADNVQYTLTTDSNLVGKRIAWERIEFGSLLSRGAFGEVWACHYAGKKVAVKRLLQSKKPTLHEAESFTHEIQLTASLNHPNIVRFIGVTWSSLENLAMVVEYLPRGDMQGYLQRNGDLITWAHEKIDMAIGIARAIAYLHSRKVIHRDIKARNVLLTKRLQPKLIDFGTSRLWAPSDMSAGVGTPFWTAPEVLKGTEYTEKADIYSFGVLLSELDTCEAPYHSHMGTNGEKMKAFRILREVVDFSLRPSLLVGCPQRIRTAADACFQQDPELRPSASELIKLLGG